MARSVATIDSPEFINIHPYNPLISKCEIKVLYVGENRNKSYISKAVAEEMANTLPGCPIVGYYVDQKEDFAGHEKRVVIDADGVKMEVLTKPYGFVAPDAKVWFQRFEDTDDLGNTTIREYLMTNGYLWTGQYEEAQRVITEGNNQSMELDEKSLIGTRATNPNSGVEFFIINDAIFSKLVILGEDVEPCFEGASITAPDISSSFSLVDENYAHTLFSMMQELKTAIESKEGGLNMEKKDEAPETVEEAVETETIVDTSAEAEEETPVEEEAEAVEDAEEPATEESVDYSLMYNELLSKYNAQETELAALREFKLAKEDEEKDALIASFYMLSDEDKAEVVANKANYSLKDINAELSILCVKNKVNFSLEDETEDVNLQFNLTEDEDTSVPAYIEALRLAK